MKKRDLQSGGGEREFPGEREKDDVRGDGAILGGVRHPQESAGLFEGPPEGDQFFLSWLDPASPSFENRGSPMLDLLKRVMKKNLI